MNIIENVLEKMAQQGYEYAASSYGVRILGDGEADMFKDTVNNMLFCLERNRKPVSDSAIIRMVTERETDEIALVFGPVAQELIRTKESRFPLIPGWTWTVQREEGFSLAVLTKDGHDGLLTPVPYWTVKLDNGDLMFNNAYPTHFNPGARLGDWIKKEISKVQYAVYAQVYNSYKLAETGFKTLSEAQEWASEEYGNGSVWIEPYSGGKAPLEVYPE